MKTRTKLFLVALVAAAIVGEVGSGGNGAGLVKLVMLSGLVWLAWRAYVIVCLLLKPVREKIAPQVDAFNHHADDAMHRSGLGALSDASNKLQSGIDGAVNATQKGIDERRRSNSN